MTTSLDGFVADEQGSIARLYPDLEALHGTPYMDGLIARTGAVIMGRRAFEMADDPDWYVGNYEFQVPIFVLTHHPPAKKPKQDDRLRFTFVTDGVASAVAQAKKAAGSKDVQVIGGASAVQQVLEAGLADEFNVGVMPVFLGAGLALATKGLERVRLEKVSVREIGQRTSHVFRVKRS